MVGLLLRMGNDRILCKLDRALVNQIRCRDWANAEAEFLEPGLSDHSPIVINWRLSYVQKRSGFKYFNMWSSHPEFAAIIMKKEILRECVSVHKAAVAFLKQKAKESWLKDGDDNTGLFHISIKQRRYHNRVLRLQDDDGRNINGQENINNTFIRFYKELFNGRQQGLH
ncbi:hypothetical protein RIF29_19726 [Crotalaria pallida]|uniref:Endonuclease/exonuclease/phosphatase n=1 Tax=Crotalaria pallida TaxID=3830 RepID=A0AAN9EZX9_CROPI